MYCIKCGVRLADTEKKCPLCDTEVYHPTLKRDQVPPLYPQGRLPKSRSGSKAINGAIIFLCLIPLLICLISDMQRDGNLSWFGFVCGAIVLGYIVFGLPLWFRRPNPVIFLPCDFAAALLYLLYIDLYTKGGWFLSFAFPTMGGLGIIICTVVTLIYYLKKGRLYVLGGAFIAIGAFMLLIEFLLDITFKLSFIGWSIYPLTVCALLGGTMIFLAINSTAREIMERKLFF